MAIVQQMFEAHGWEGAGKVKREQWFHRAQAAKKLRFPFARSVAVARQVHHEQFRSLSVLTESVEGRTETILRHALRKSGQAISINH